MGLLVIASVTSFVANATISYAGPFEARDTSWEGGSELLALARSELGEDRVVPISVLDWSTLKPDDALLLLHPDHALGADKLAAFLGNGGRVAVIDDFGAGDKILERFQIERVPPPSHPLASLRNNPSLAIAEPVREPLANHGMGVHATVEDVDRLVTNHPTGLRNPKATPVLQIRSVEGTGPDVAIALAGNFGSPPKGKLFAMGDPSALMNQMLGYPGNRAFAKGLLRYLASGDPAAPSGRVLVIANRFEESGSYGGATGFKAEFDDRVDALGQGLRRVLHEGFSGIVGAAVAALSALSVGLWLTSVSSRIYRRRAPSFARSVPLVAQGGIAGRAAMLLARSTAPALAVLELKSALEETLSNELGIATWLPPARLLEEISRAHALDDQRYGTLKGLLLEMANVETMVAASQPGRVKRADVLRVSRVASDIVTAVRKNRRRKAA